MLYLFITAAVFLLDFVVKSYIDKHYIKGERHPHVRNKIILEKYYNNGAALNLLEKKPKLLKAIHTIILFFVGVAYYFVIRYSSQPLTKTGISLLLGGGMSNLFDRYTKGHVIDYFHINIGPKWFKRIVFNISDFCIFIGALLTVLSAEQP